MYGHVGLFSLLTFPEEGKHGQNGGKFLIILHLVLAFKNAKEYTTPCIKDMFNQFQEDDSGWMVFVFENCPGSMARRTADRDEESFVNGCRAGDSPLFLRDHDSLC